MSEYSSQGSGWEGGESQHSGVVPSGAANKNRLFWHSFLGIVLGVSVGGLVLWFLFDEGRPQKPPIRRNAIQIKPLDRPATPLLLAKASTQELYRRSRQEVDAGRFGSTTNWLHGNRRNFALWVHVYWQLAEGSLRAKNPLQAARVFQTLVEQKQTLWSKRLLNWRAAEALLKGGQRASAQKLLAQVVRAKRNAKQQGWLWQQQDRHAVAEALWLYASMQKGATRFRLWQRLWLDYPESPRAIAASTRWWKEWRKRKPKTEILFQAAARYIDAFGDLSRARTLLRSSKRKARSRRQKRQLQELWFAYAEASADRNKMWRELRQVAKKKRRRQQGRLYYQMATIALPMKRSRTWRKTLKTLRRRSRYWYAKALVDKGRRDLAMGSKRSAEKAWRKAWRASKNRALRMEMYLYRGISQLKGSKRSARKAKKEFAQAARQFQRMSRRDQAEQMFGLLAYWQARSEQRRGKKDAAIKQWTTLFQRAPFSFYGNLASQRLQELGQLPPLNTNRAAGHIWQPGKGTSHRERVLRLLQAEGPPELLALELENLAMSTARRPMALSVYLAQHSQPNHSLSNALLWLHRERDRFLHGQTRPSRDLLMTAYPLPDTRWPDEIKEARSYGLDARLVAALLLHKRGFHPDTRRSQRPGPVTDPLWLPTPLDPPRSFAANCKTLRDLLRQFNDVGLAVEALLTQDLRKVKRLQRTFGQKIADLRYPLMSPETHIILQTYWIYKYLYLQ